MYPRYDLLFVFTYHVVTGLSLPATTYDQRQTGDLNVQVHLKDVQVLALLDPELLDDYTEYDYFYDYADFTIKPIVKPTTSTTTTTTETTLLTSEITEAIASEISNSTLQNSSFSAIELNTNSTIESTVLSSVNATETNETLADLSNENSENSTNAENTSRIRVNNKTKKLFDNGEETSTKQKEWRLSTEDSSNKLSRKHCRSGYSPDGKGRCRRLSQRKLSLIPLAMRLAPKLFDDLARGTKNLIYIQVVDDPKPPRKRTNLSHSRGTDFVQLGRFEWFPEDLVEMPLHVACLILLSGILSESFIPQVNAAPAIYDQRQTGDFNVDTKFENFLVIVATSGSSGLFSNLASQALELNELISQRSKQQSREKPSETMIYETEDADGGREPYHVEIVHIEKEGDSTARSKHPDKLPGAKSSEKIELGTLSKDNEKTNSQQTVDSVLSIDSKEVLKKTRSLWKGEGQRDLIDDSIEPNKRSTDIRNSSVENLDHSDDLPVKEEALKATRPGISLKKQLSKKEEEDEPSISEERNELGGKYQELVLLGGGIENCGPGRYRDKLGICQHDKNFN
ncbi:PREDICTED: uncharacterized protein LOC108548813 [Eufriesea mexicana]|uniref:uncharacterized protein LOC108548813 n=1 Tax=Eufriesea mexicana TaxID=516756 RepID=UPI00083BD4DB|nr:PREDICTED: uncharacterized protein LOC108548813 [Eufriesea mexicana]